MNKKQLLPCGCGGESKVIFPFMHTDVYLVECNECGICTSSYNTESEAVTAWNTAMGGLLPEGDPQKNVGCKYTTTTERTAKVECVAEVYRGEIVDHYLSGICEICGEPTYDHAKYCS